MPMQYEYTAIPESQVPRAANPIFQHLLDTYASETSKVISVWRQFAPEDMPFKPAERSSSGLHSSSLRRQNAAGVSSEGIRAAAAGSPSRPMNSAKNRR